MLLSTKENNDFNKFITNPSPNFAKLFAIVHTKSKHEDTDISHLQKSTVSLNLFSTDPIQTTNADSDLVGFFKNKIKLIM